MKKELFLLLILLSLYSCSRLDRIDPAGIEVNIESDSIVFAEIGDFGFAGLHENSVSKLVKSWNPDFIISAGDNNYYNGELSTLKTNVTQFYGDYIYNYDAPLSYQCDGKAFKDRVNRFFPTPGNHDANNKDKLTPYYNFFTLPGNESYYKLNWGPVSFYSLNSATGDIKEQQTWLKQQVALSQNPFQIVFFHHPPYSTGGHGNNEAMQWDFYGMGIDVVFTGHDHIYNRIEKEDEKGLYYIVNGLGGKEAYGCNEHPLSSELFNSFCYASDYGAIKVIATRKRMILEFYTVGAPAEYIDRVVIEKSF